MAGSPLSKRWAVVGLVVERPQPSLLLKRPASHPMQLTALARR